MNRIMETEHEKLKEVCEEIGYESYSDIGFDNDTKFFMKGSRKCSRGVDSREIIYTNGFIEKMNKHYLDVLMNEGHTPQEITDTLQEYFMGYFSHLDDPVTYLYELLNLGNKGSES